MDELELLKKDWKKNRNNFPQLSYEQIYNMLLKKSSSIVQWIFIISVIEFVFWAVLDFFLSTKESENTIRELNMEAFYNATNIFNYAVLTFFVIKFYLNFRKIKSTDSARELMKNILKTRRTVKHYVWFNIGFFAFVVSATFMFIMNNSALFKEDDLKFKLGIIIILGFLIALSIMLGVLWLFYRLLYGILTRRLKSNYKELKELEN